MKTPLSQPPALPRAAALIGVFGIALVALAGLGIRLLGQNNPMAVDVYWHDLMAKNRNSVLETVALVLNTVGGTAGVALTTLAIVAAFLVARRWRTAVTVGAAVAVAFVACTLIKLGIDRPRPSDALLHSTSGSFPSGHVTTAAALVVALALTLPRAWAWVAAGAWVALMAFSRTYLLAHWVTDVLAAIVLGIAAALVVSATIGGLWNLASGRGTRRGEWG